MGVRQGKPPNREFQINVFVMSQIIKVEIPNVEWLVFFNYIFLFQRATCHTTYVILKTRSFSTSWVQTALKNCWGEKVSGSHLKVWGQEYFQTVLNVAWILLFQVTYNTVFSDDSEVLEHVFKKSLKKQLFHRDMRS